MLTHQGTQTIETKRLTLRRFALSDGPLMFKNWASDEVITRYMRWEPHDSVETTIAILTDWMNGYDSDKTYHWAICLKDGEPIGSIAVLKIEDGDGCGEIGYCIGQAFWGNGYTTEAVAAVIDYMFASVGMERIEAYHAVNNPASGRVMEKAGMVLEGFARHKYRSRLGFQDCNMYGIIRSDRQNAVSTSI